MNNMFEDDFDCYDKLFEYDPIYIDNSEYICSHCGKKCYPTWVDEGYDGYKYGSSSGVHHDWKLLSDCCLASVDKIEQE